MPQGTSQQAQDHTREAGLSMTLRSATRGLDIFERSYSMHYLAVSRTRM